MRCLSIRSVTVFEARCVDNVLHHLAVKLVPVGNTSVESSNVNVVEALFSVDPVAACIIDLELQIRWYLVGLSG